MNATANLSIIISFALHMKKHVKSQDQIDSYHFSINPYQTSTDSLMSYDITSNLMC